MYINMLEICIHLHMGMHIWLKGGVGSYLTFTSICPHRQESFNNYFF